MAKVKITELPIYVYSCASHPDRDHIAFIGDLPMKFKGQGQQVVRKIADSWRFNEVAKIERLKRSQADRIEKMQAARQKKQAMAKVEKDA